MTIPTNLRTIAESLGGYTVFQREIASDLDLAREVEVGFPSASLSFVLRDLGEAAVSQQAVYAVVGSARTLQRKRQRDTRLSRDESDRLARLVRLIARAEEALGSREKALRWLAKPNRALEGASPISLLASDAGALAVERVLGRIEHGVFA